MRIDFWGEKGWKKKLFLCFSPKKSARTTFFSKYGKYCDYRRDYIKNVIHENAVVIVFWGIVKQQIVRESA